MVIINPSYIKFETTEEVIDYVTLGFPPTKKNFEKIIESLKSEYDVNTPQLTTKITNQVIIPKYVDNTDNEKLAEYLERVYKNQVINRNAIIITGAVIGGAILLKSIL